MSGYAERSITVVVVWLLSAAAAEAASRSELFAPVPPGRAGVAAASVALGDAAVRRRLVRVVPETLARTRAAASGGASSASLSLSLFDDAVFTALADSVEPTFSGGYSISGRLAEDPLGSVVLVVNDGRVSGSLRSVHGTYSVRSVGAGVHAIVEVDESRIPLECEERSRPADQPRNDAADGATVLPDLPDLAIPAVSSSTAVPSTIQDVAVVYTTAARTHEGGTAQITDRIDLMIAETNAAYVASGVDLGLRLVGAEHVDYTEASHPATDHDALELGEDGLDHVHDWRDAIGADIVALLTDWKVEGVNGIAPFISSPHAGTDDTAFIAVSVRKPGSLVFAHEVGHLMGLRHDRYVTCANCGAHPYSYGYVNRKAFEAGAPGTARWRTIMAYDSECNDNDFFCRWLARHSNPSQSHPEVDGDPLGRPSLEDAARSINLSRDTIANYRSFDDPSVSFGSASYTATEGGSDAEVKVVLDEAAGRPVVIPLTVAASGGASPNDYEGVPATVRFATGESEKTFSVKAVDDDADDDGESIEIALGSFLDKGSTDKATVTLADNDAVDGAPAVAAVAITSDPGSDDVYALGDEIEVTVTFTKSVIGHGNSCARPFGR